MACDCDNVVIYDFSAQISYLYFHPIGYTYYYNVVNNNPNSAYNAVSNFRSGRQRNYGMHLVENPGVIRPGSWGYVDRPVDQSFDLIRNDMVVGDIRIVPPTLYGSTDFADLRGPITRRSSGLSAADNRTYNNIGTVNFRLEVFPNSITVDLTRVTQRLTVLDVISGRILRNLNSGPVSEETRIQLRSDSRFLEGIARELRNDLGLPNNDES